MRRPIGPIADAGGYSLLDCTTVDRGAETHTQRWRWRSASGPSGSRFSRRHDDDWVFVFGWRRGAGAGRDADPHLDLAPSGPKTHTQSGHTQLQLTPHRLHVTRRPDRMRIQYKNSTHRSVERSRLTHSRTVSSRVCAGPGTADRRPDGRPVRGRVGSHTKLLNHLPRGPCSKTCVTQPWSALHGTDTHI